VSDILITSRPAGQKQAIGNGRGSVGRVAADWLCLGATPTFAIMALLTALGGGEPDILCTAMPHASPLSGMIPMYLLMSAFHSAPWLKLFAVDRRRGAGRCGTPLESTSLDVGDWHLATLLECPQD
jgi:hypothetical protein